MDNSVAFLDLCAAYRELQPQLDAAVACVLASGHSILGPEVEAFKAEYADYCGARHCIGVANGLAALHLALRAMGVGEGTKSSFRPIPICRIPDAYLLVVSVLRELLHGG
jgi:hypothetical protein